MSTGRAVTSLNLLAVGQAFDIGEKRAKPHRLAAFGTAGPAGKVPRHHVDMRPVRLFAGKAAQEQRGGDRPAITRRAGA